MAKTSHGQYVCVNKRYNELYLLNSKERSISDVFPFCLRLSKLVDLAEGRRAFGTFWPTAASFEAVHRFLLGYALGFS